MYDFSNFFCGHYIYLILKKLESHDHKNLSGPSIFIQFSSGYDVVSIHIVKQFLVCAANLSYVKSGTASLVLKD